MSVGMAWCLDSSRWWEPATFFKTMMYIAYSHLGTYANSHLEPLGGQKHPRNQSQKKQCQPPKESSIPTGLSMFNIVYNQHLRLKRFASIWGPTLLLEDLNISPMRICKFSRRKKAVGYVNIQVFLVDKNNPPPDTNRFCTQSLFQGRAVICSEGPTWMHGIRSHHAFLTSAVGWIKSIP